MRYVHALAGIGFMLLAGFQVVLFRSDRTGIHPSLGVVGAPLVVVAVFTFGAYLLLRQTSQPAIARIGAVCRIAAFACLAALTLKAGFGNHFATADRVVLLFVGVVLVAVTVLLVRAQRR